MINTFCYVQIHLISHGKANRPSAFEVSLLIRACARRIAFLSSTNTSCYVSIGASPSFLRIEDEPFSVTYLSKDLEQCVCVDVSRRSLLPLFSYESQYLVLR